MFGSHISKLNSMGQNPHLPRTLNGGPQIGMNFGKNSGRSVAIRKTDISKVADHKERAEKKERIQWDISANMAANARPPSDGWFSTYHQRTWSTIILAAISLGPFPLIILSKLSYTTCPAGPWKKNPNDDRTIDRWKSKGPPVIIV